MEGNISDISATNHFLCWDFNSSSHCDRFFMALYRKILDPGLAGSTKLPLFLNLVYKSMKSDVVEKRSKVIDAFFSLLCICVCICVCIYIHIYMHIYIYMCLRTHTYMYIYCQIFPFVNENALCKVCRVK